MTAIFSLEFLIAVLFIIDVFLVISLLLFARRINQRVSENGSQETPPQKPDDSRAFTSAREILDLLEPLVKESRRAALSFDEQIREKRKLSKHLNDALDTRIISINLLLSRAAALQKKMEDRQQETRPADPIFSVAPSFSPQSNVLDQQNQIIELYYQKKDVDTIAEKLSIPKGEVQLVIDLKEKFIAMEKG